MKHLILVWHAFQYYTEGHALTLSTVVMDDRSQVLVGIETVDEASTVLVLLFDRSWNFGTDMKEYWNLIVVSSVLDANGLVETLFGIS